MPVETRSMPIASAQVLETRSLRWADAAPILAPPEASLPAIAAASNPAIVLPKPVEAPGGPGGPASPPTAGGGGGDAGGQWNGTVSGVVRSANGRPLPNAPVEAFHVTLRNSQTLGKAQTDQNGAYRIAYSVPQPAGTPKPTVNLQVRVYDPANAAAQTVFVSSALIPNATAAETVDLMVGGATYAGPSALESLTADIAPHLGRLQLAQLAEDKDNQDVSLLSDVTGRPPAQIGLASIAARLAATTNLPPALFFGLMSQNLPPGVASMVLAKNAAGVVDMDANASAILPALFSEQSATRTDALNAAVSANAIPLDYKDAAAADLAQLDAQAVTYALNTPLQGAKAPAEAILTTFNIAPAAQTAFMGQYVKAAGSMQAFWQNLPKNAGLTTEQVGQIQFALEVGGITKEYLPLLGQIETLYSGGQIKSSKDLAKYSEAQWAALLNTNVQGKPIGAPASMDGANDAAKIAAYAHFLAQEFARAHPTIALTARIADDPAPPAAIASKDDLVTFLNNNPTFSLTHTNLDAYLKAQAAKALTGVQDAKTLRASVMAVQRVSKLFSSYDVVKPLLADGITSAQQIYAMGHDQFVSRYGANAAIGAGAAKAIYARAANTYANTLATVAKWNFGMNSGNPAAIQSSGTAAATQQAIVEFPNLQALFGSMDFCECDDCSSVLSPAAYLVDILFFLEQRLSNTANVSVKDVLFQRRPDLGVIALNCQNTNTTLPYIDLVNEILEDAVSPPPLPQPLPNPLPPQIQPGVSGAVQAEEIAAYTRQSAGTSEELAANPEWVNAKAYTALAGAVFPWSLPFNFPLEQARIYLSQLGVARADVMRPYQGTPPASATDARAIAIEMLGLSDIEAQIITGSYPNSAKPLSFWSFWGLNEKANKIPDPADNTKTISGDWLSVIQNVRVLLNRASVTFAELSQVLNTQFVNGDNLLKFVPGASDSTGCNVNSMTVPGLDAAHADRLHRFVRLWRKLGWTPYELDKAITALQGKTATLNDGFLWQLSQVSSAMTALSLPVVSVLGFWAVMDTADIPLLPGQTSIQRSLYSTLFQNPVVLSPVDSAFALKPDGSELAAVSTLSAHTATILAALGCTNSDLTFAMQAITAGNALSPQSAAIVAAVPFGPVAAMAGAVIGDVLNLANLSALLRHFTLANAMGVSIRDLVSLMTLTTINPFNAARPDALNAFLNEAGKVAASGFTIAGLDYLLRDVVPDRSGLRPGDVAIGTTIRSIRDGLQQIQRQNLFVSDPKGITTKKKLGALLAPTDVNVIMDILGGTSPLAAADKQNFLTTALGPYLNTALPADALVGNAALTAGARRYDYVFPLVTASLQAPQPDPTGTVTQQRLGQILGAADVKTAMAILGGTSQDSAAVQQAFIATNFSAFVDSASAQANLVGAAALPLGQARYEYVLQPLTAYLLVSDPSGALTPVWLAQILTPADVTTAMAILDGTSQDSAAVQQDFLAAAFDPFFSSVTAQASLAGPTALAAGTARRNAVLGPLIEYLNIFASDTTGGLTQQRLELALQSADAATAMKILAGTSALSPAAQTAFINGGAFQPLAAYATPQTALAGGPALPKQPAYDYVLARLLKYLARAASAQFVKQQLASAVQADASVVAALLDTYLPSGFDSSQPSLEEFLRLSRLPRAVSAVDATPIADTEPGFSTAFDTFRLFDKCALVFTTFSLTATEVAWLFANGVSSTRPNAVTGTVAGWLDPTKLPPSSSAAPMPGALYAAWERLADYAALSAALPAGPVPLTALFDEARANPAPAWPGFAADLANRTAWSLSDIALLAGSLDGAKAGMLPLKYPLDYTDETALVRLAPCLTMAANLGVSADVSAWIGLNMAQSDADAIKQTIKAKYSNDQWLAIAKPLRDRLRQRQRDSLVAYLLVNPPAPAAAFQNVDDIYGYYLIDIEMNPCQLTTRILQAAAAVQLFVQRCLLNAETQVTADSAADSVWLQWEWMQNYRVWQANREIFLFPENWVRPELRHDASSFFTDLQNELQQSNLTGDTAETAFLNYLEKLDQVARLQVVGLFYQADEHHILHVVARSHGDPATYYYRQRDTTGAWSAWSKIDLDIVSKHIMPTVYNRRLYLFWLIFTNKPNANTTYSDPTQSNDPPPNPSTHWEIQLAWSEYKDGKWQAKQTAPQMVIATASNPSVVATASNPGGSYPLEAFTAKTVVPDDSSPLRIDLFYPSPWSNLFSYHHPALVLIFSQMGGFEFTGGTNPVQAYIIEGTPATPASGDSAVSVEMRPIPNSPSFVLPTFSTADAMAISEGNGPSQTVYVLYSNKGSSSASLGNEALLDYKDHSSLLVPHQDLAFDSTLPFFYEDAKRSYIVSPTIYAEQGYYQVPVPPLAYMGNITIAASYLFEPYYHPYVMLFIRELNRSGIPGLLNLTLQTNPTTISPPIAPLFDGNAFANYYQPTVNVHQPYPAESVDFTPTGAYSIYNWELFFHAPLLIANALSQNQQFNEARQWYEYIFDPTNTTKAAAPQRFWITAPFNQEQAPAYQSQQLQTLLAENSAHSDLQTQVAAWIADPFDPHAIAKFRLVAYQRNVVMQYISNLIAWGDQLFSQDTFESVNEATQLYVLAQEMLGPKPEFIPPRATPPPKTYNELEKNLNVFSDEMVAVENILPLAPGGATPNPAVPALPTLPTLYFCIPPNDTLLAYWDTVEDRLFKIRNCMNIEGVVQQLALYAPPINPALLVQAAASGLDLSSILSDLSAPLPHYRFTYMAQKAKEYAAEVKSLGSELQQAWEKRDAEELALLRSAGELRLVQQSRAVKQRQIDEAQQNIVSLQKNQATVTARRDYYCNVSFMNAAETTAMALTAQALIPEIASQVLEAAAGSAALVPGLQFGGSGFGGTPHVSAYYSGLNVKESASSYANVLRIVSTLLRASAQKASVLGGYQRRADEWGLQCTLANKELDQIAAQMAAAQIRLDIANKELNDYDIQIKNASDVDALLHSKYTNKELYEWMISQIAAIYFQSYQLAYGIAQQAERCFRYELGLSDSSFIQFGYWDSLKKGLLAGERLLGDLGQMECAYIETNGREREIPKSISLLSLDPIALVKLKETGSCFFSLPEILFDLDTPSHYLRRMKSVALTIPCVVGPYTSVSATLTLLQNSVRATTNLTGGYKRTGSSDPRFRDDAGGTDAICTSSALNDSGLFETNFRDERYLPFEGAGAISQWRLELTATYPQFDYASISDVVLHLHYTARDGGDAFGATVKAEVKQEVNKMALAESRTGLYRLFSARHDFPTNWQQFLHPQPGADQTLQFDSAPNRFPFFTSELYLKVTGVELLAVLSDNAPYTAAITAPNTAAGTSIPASLLQDPPAAAAFGSLHYWTSGAAPAAGTPTLNFPIPLGSRALSSPAPANPWSMKLQKTGAADFKSLDPATISDIFIILTYEVAATP